ncbi:MAG: PTS sugar transporter subunit IIC [Deltaproteobacteria bacterium]|jgi:mannose/fructose/N-acetylgalactosamine-specific phosphotransferase system component IIC|nr:PTS sugar transporter subunit IIC [Deltaproteobacteria bacterium]
MPPILWGLLAASLLNLDRQSFGHNMLARPLATGFLIGWATAQPQAGLTLGLWAELLWLARPPLGGFIVPNGGLAVSAALLAWGLAASPATGPDAALAAGRPTPGSLTLLFAAVPPLAHLAVNVERLARARSTRMVARLEAELLEGASPPLLWYNLRGLLVTLAASLVFLAVSAAALAGLLKLAEAGLPAAAWAALAKFEPFAPLAGLTVLAENLHGRRLLAFAALMTACCVFQAL